MQSSDDKMRIGTTRDNAGRYEDRNSVDSVMGGPGPRGG